MEKNPVCLRNRKNEQIRVAKHKLKKNKTFTKDSPLAHFCTYNSTKEVLQNRHDQRNSKVEQIQNRLISEI